MKLRRLSSGFVCGVAAMAITITGAAVSTAAPGDEGQDFRRAVEQAARVTDFHKKLKPIRGKYTQTIKWWSSPTAEPVESTSRSDTEWILGGRFLKQEFQGKWMEMPFKAVAILGYDRGAKEYTSVWMDTLGTKILFNRGTCDEKRTAITMHGEYINAVTGETVKAKSIMQMPNKKGELKIEVFRTGSDGQEFKCLEVVTKRLRQLGA